MKKTLTVVLLVMAMSVMAIAGGTGFWRYTNNSDFEFKVIEGLTFNTVVLHNESDDDFKVRYVIYLENREKYTGVTGWIFAHSEQATGESINKSSDVARVEITIIQR